MRSADSHSRVDAILCDVGDVLILWDKEIPAAIERAYGLPDGSVLFEILKSHAGKLATIGRVTHEEWLREVTCRLPDPAARECLPYHPDFHTQSLILLPPPPRP